MGCVCNSYIIFSLTVNQELEDQCSCNINRLLRKYFFEVYDIVIGAGQSMYGMIWLFSSTSMQLFSLIAGLTGGVNYLCNLCGVIK